MKGLTHWKNKENRFNVIRLHYSADPDKDPDTPKGKKYIEQAKAGMPTEGWKREMEIDWSAGAGRPVYPDFTMRQVKKLKWHPELIIYRGWDRGRAHPACHWSCIDNLKRWLWLREELGTEISAWDFIPHCIEITMAKFPNALVIDYFPPDTKIESDVSRKDDELSFLQIAQNKFSLAPIVPPLGGVQDRIDIISKQMMLRADGQYGMLVDPSCHICIEALQGGYHRSPKEARADEVVKDGYYDHLMDAASHTAAGIFLLTGEGPQTDIYDVEPVYRRNSVTAFIED